MSENPRKTQAPRGGEGGEEGSGEGRRREGEGRECIHMGATAPGEPITSHSSCYPLALSLPGMSCLFDEAEKLLF